MCTQTKLRILRTCVQCGLGVAGLQPAASMECKTIATQVRINRPAAAAAQLSTAPSRESDLDRADSSGSEEPSQPVLGLVVQADAELCNLVTGCCLETLWPLPAAVKEVERSMRAPREVASAAETPGRVNPFPAEAAAGSVGFDGDAAAAEVADADWASAPGGMERQTSQGLGLGGEGLQTQMSRQPSQLAGNMSLRVLVEDWELSNEDLLLERSLSGSQASASPSPTSAAEAARAAWASSARSPFLAEADGAIGTTSRRLTSDGGRASSAFSGAGQEQLKRRRTLGLKLSPRPAAVSLAAERLLGRGASSFLDDEEAQDSSDSGGRSVQFSVEWEACLRIDANSSLQLVSAAGVPQLRCGFDGLAISGKSLTALRIGSCVVDSTRRKSGDNAPFPAKQNSASGRRDQSAAAVSGRAGLFTAEFSVQVSPSAMCCFGTSSDAKHRVKS